MATMGTLPFYPRRGKICRLFVWNGSGHDEHLASIRDIAGYPGGVNEPALNLTYSDGTGGIDQANNVLNVEMAGPTETYWEEFRQPNPDDALELLTCTRPSAGELRWVGFWDGVEHVYVPAIVRAVPGSPTDPTPNLNVTYFDFRTGIESDADLNGVVAATTLTEPERQGENIWFDFVLDE